MDLGQPLLPQLVLPREAHWHHGTRALSLSQLRAKLRNVPADALLQWLRSDPRLAAIAPSTALQHWNAHGSLWAPPREPSSLASTVLGLEALALAGRRGEARVVHRLAMCRMLGSMTRTWVTRGHTHCTHCAKWHPIDSVVFTGADDGLVKAWTSQGHLMRTLRGHTSEVMDIWFSSDGLFVAAAFLDAQDGFTVWRYPQFEQVLHRAGEVIHCCFILDQPVLVVAYHASVVGFLLSASPPVEVFAYHFRQPVDQLAMASPGAVVVSLRDGGAQVLDCTRLSSPVPATTWALATHAVAADWRGRIAVYGCERQHEMAVFSLPRGNCSPIAPIEWMEQGDVLSNLAWSCNGLYLYAVVSSARLGRVALHVLSGSTGAMGHLLASVDVDEIGGSHVFSSHPVHDDVVAVGSNTSGVSVVCWRSCKPVLRRFESTLVVLDAQWSRDGCALLFSDSGGSIVLWGEASAAGDAQTAAPVPRVQWFSTDYAPPRPGPWPRWLDPQAPDGVLVNEHGVPHAGDAAAIMEPVVWPSAASTLEAAGAFGEILPDAAPGVESSSSSLSSSSEDDQEFFDGGDGELEDDEEEEDGDDGGDEDDGGRGAWSARRRPVAHVAAVRRTTRSTSTSQPETAPMEWYAEPEAPRPPRRAMLRARSALSGEEARARDGDGGDDVQLFEEASASWSEGEEASRTSGSQRPRLELSWWMQSAEPSAQRASYIPQLRDRVVVFHEGLVQYYDRFCPWIHDRPSAEAVDGLEFVVTACEYHRHESSERDAYAALILQRVDDDGSSAPVAVRFHPSWDVPDFLVLAAEVADALLRLRLGAHVQAYFVDEHAWYEARVVEFKAQRGWNSVGVRWLAPGHDEVHDDVALLGDVEWMHPWELFPRTEPLGALEASPVPTLERSWCVVLHAQLVAAIGELAVPPLHRMLRAQRNLVNSRRFQLGQLVYPLSLQLVLRRLRGLFYRSRDMVLFELQCARAMYALDARSTAERTALAALMGRCEAIVRDLPEPTAPGTAHEEVLFTGGEPQLFVEAPPPPRSPHPGPRVRVVLKRPRARDEPLPTDRAARRKHPARYVFDDEDDPDDQGVMEEDGGAAQRPSRARRVARDDDDDFDEGDPDDEDGDGSSGSGSEEAAPVRRRSARHSQQQPRHSKEVSDDDDDDDDDSPPPRRRRRRRSPVRRSSRRR